MSPPYLKRKSICACKCQDVRVERSNREASADHWQTQLAEQGNWTERVSVSQGRLLGPLWFIDLYH